VTLTTLIGTLVLTLLPVFMGVLVSMWNRTRDTLTQNEKAINRMETKLDLVWADFQTLSKIKSDVDAAHLKIRELKDIKEKGL